MWSFEREAKKWGEQVWLPLLTGFAVKGGAGGLGMALEGFYAGRLVLGRAHWFWGIANAR